MPEEALVHLSPMRRRPTSERPLLGLTVLVVEDSRFACEALRLLCLRSGARIRRADCLASAHRHLAVYRPSVAVVDLGLPDGNGSDLITELCHSDPKVPVIIGTSGDSSLETDALKAGADIFLEKPILDLTLFQETILSFLPNNERPKGPRALDQHKVDPDTLALRDDLNHVSDILSAHEDGETLDYVAQFLSSVAVSATDKDLAEAAQSLSTMRRNGAPCGPAIARITQVVGKRLETAKPV